jgi:hypothetical protein
MGRTYYHPPFVIEVNTSGQYVEDDFEFDRRIQKITGVQVTAHYQDRAYLRGTQYIEINGDPILPEDYDTKMLISNSGVDPNPRFLYLGDIKPGNLKCKIKYQDTDHPSAPFVPYKIKYHFKCEM